MVRPVVDFQEIESGIVVLKMEDRIHKNTFSEELILGLINSFQIIKNNLEYKVVILIGYDNYFASGGTQEALINIYEGNSIFTDTNIYSLVLNCPIPVIAAMQGHGIGCGFVMGLFADIVILSRKSVYTANFMKYGFTPGMGATHILPAKLGISLAEELLLTAGTYLGEELQQRGIPFQVLPRQEVFEYSLQKARQLAEKPRISLVTLKDHLVAKMRQELPLFIEQELLMHKKTFHNPEVKDKIIKLFSNHQ